MYTDFINFKIDIKLKDKKEKEFLCLEEIHQLALNGKNRFFLGFFTKKCKSKLKYFKEPIHKSLALL